MDKTLQRIYSIPPQELARLNDTVMLGSGQHGLCLKEGKGVRVWDLNGK